MDIDIIRAFFMWCTILNLGLLIFSSLMCVCAGDWVYRMHSKWFSIPREAFNVAIYSFIGLYKVLVIVFNVIPYLALLIIG
ncbi:MAG: hypothetical protein JRD93_20085 [Deltaproteobacteria bacterium]|nr:hypothetical protein [Deltaproteobacteria bacterium]